MPCNLFAVFSRRIHFFNRDPVLTLSDLCNKFEGRLNPLQKRWGPNRSLFGRFLGQIGTQLMVNSDVI